MDGDGLIRARRKAEMAVKDMDEGPLKVAAFQTVLNKLLADLDRPDATGSEGNRTAAGSGGIRSLRGRILAIKSEGFFQSQQALNDVREALGSRGWHYPQTTLSGVMQALVRQRQLRRERVMVGGKKLWRYSNP